MPIAEERLNEVRKSLGRPDEIKANAFHLLQTIAGLTFDRQDEAIAQELILRALENRDAFGSSEIVLEGLVREMGLFPYLDQEKLTFRDHLAYETHRPEKLEDGIVFHAPQAKVYWAILDGKNVVLSAPTSFGKSLITDAVIATRRYDNIMIVVPTIALIDEIRRRLTQRFRESYKVVTQPFQRLSERNLLIFTQERALEFSEWERIQWVVIDEYYKLSPESVDDDRAAKLNEVLYRTLNSRKQFYLLGPNVGGITDELARRVGFELFSEEFRTVVSEQYTVEGDGDELPRLADLCRALTDATIIFCSSPQRASETAKFLLDAGVGEPSAASVEAAEWVSKTFHPDWTFARGLTRGIGLHHGRIPRALGQFVVNAFNDGHIKFLVCTSTLIEGVNTRAKNIVIFHNTIANKKIDFFTFNNIRGRSGRMFQHFIGNVYLFQPAPAEELRQVDVPVLTQSELASTTLLMQIDQAEWSAASRAKMEPFLLQTLIPFEILKLNDVAPESQLAVAHEIANSPGKYPLLRWTGVPRWEQLVCVCELIFKYWSGRTLGNRSAISSRQLAFLLWRLSQNPPIKELIENQNTPPYQKTPDEAVERVLDFVRLWANINFPRYLRVINNIQKEIYRKQGRASGEYEFYAARAEHLFLDPTFLTLDEYGLPTEISRKLANYLKPNGEWETVVRQLQSLDLAQTPLDPFERKILEQVRQSL